MIRSHEENAAPMTKQTTTKKKAATKQTTPRRSAASTTTHSPGHAPGDAAATHAASHDNTHAPENTAAPKRTGAGRPTDYSPEIATRICTLIAEGRSLTSLCDNKSPTRIDGFPCMMSVMNWLRKYPEFVEQYARARETQAERYAQEITDIADSSMMTREEVEVAKLRIDARKWVAAKLLPKKYGDTSRRELSVEGTIKHDVAGDLQDMAARMAKKHGFAPAETKPLENDRAKTAQVERSASGTIDDKGQNEPESTGEPKGKG